MKWVNVELIENAHVAREHVLRNLAVGAKEHPISDRLVSRFGSAGGPVWLFTYEGIETACITDFDSSPPDTDRCTDRWTFTIGARAIDGLVEYLERYSVENDSNLVLLENFFRSEADTVVKNYASEVLFCEGSVYHLLRGSTAERDRIEQAYSDATSHFTVGLCSKYIGPFPDSRISKAAADSIVASTVHIFTEALDSEGFILWSPTSTDGWH